MLLLNNIPTQGKVLHMKKQLLLLITLATLANGALQAITHEELYTHITSTFIEDINMDLVTRYCFDGGTPWSNYNGIALIHEAATKGLTNVLAVFLEHMKIKNIHIDTQSDTGWTALHYASVTGYADTVELLVDSGADINALTLSGYSQRTDYTPLHIAVLHGNTAAAQKLVQLGADTTIKNGQGKTAADYTRRASGEFPGDREILFDNRKALGKLLEQKN